MFPDSVLNTCINRSLTRSVSVSVAKDEECLDRCPVSRPVIPGRARARSPSSRPGTAWSSAGGPRQGAIAELEAWHRLVIGGRPEQVSVARAFIRQVLGVGHPGTERVTLLTSELVTNSVNHSDSRLEGGTITVTVRTAADRVRVEVQDDGGPTAPTLRCDDDLAEAGRGLRLVAAYSVIWD